MQKGRSFEREIEKVLDYINKIGGHAHKNYAHRTQDGIYIKGEAFDYEVFLKDYKCVFDAKECGGSIWYMQKKDIIQANNLKKCKNCGLDAYFLIFFENKEVKQIDIDDVIRVLEAGKKSISKSLGEEWRLLKMIRGEVEKCK